MARKNKKIGIALCLAVAFSGAGFFPFRPADGEEIRERQREVASQKERWRPFIEELKKGKESHFFDRMAKTLSGGALVAYGFGSAGAYFLLDAEGEPQFVIKPVDEHIFCLNNPRENSSVYNDEDHRVREGIPLYRSAQTDAACWEIATLAGLSTATAPAVLAIVDHPQFYGGALKTGREKLCSVQEYLPHTQKLNELAEGLLAQGLTPEEIGLQIDQSDFEEACLLTWLIYDNDANSTNFCIYEKSEQDSVGRYGLKKIDNDLSLPEKHTGYFNVLAYFPNALLVVSEDLREKIARLPVNELLAVLDRYELLGSKAPFLERLHLLQTLIKTEEISVAEIDERLRKL